MENNNSTGPYDPSVLHLQASHRSELVWQAGYIDPLYCRCEEAVINRVTRPNPRIDPYLRQSGFYGVSHIKCIQLDWHLITAFVERWRQETHTFHLPHGECTITLQDVAIQFGLPVDGKALIGTFQHNWQDVCTELLGVTPGEGDLIDGRLSLQWLVNQFDGFAHLAEDVDGETLQRYATTYILTLIGAIVFPDKSSSRVHLMYLPLLANLSTAGQYNWGAGCLAWLYRQLCKTVAIDAEDIEGPVILLQIWAWDHFPLIAPHRLHIHENNLGDRPLAIRWNDHFRFIESLTHVLTQYRFMLDQLMPDQIMWEPYKYLIGRLPECCLIGHHIWRTRSPLICFYVVEWQFPDRVMRQFGRVKYIPIFCNTDIRLHTYDLCGHHERNWEKTLDPQIQEWENRQTNIINGQPINEGADVEHNYNIWFNHISRRFLTQAGAAYHNLNDMPNMTDIDRIHLSNVTEIYRSVQLSGAILDCMRRRQQRRANISNDDPNEQE